MTKHAPCACYPQGNDGDCPAPGCRAVPETQPLTGDTPRTDAVAVGHGALRGQTVDAEFARQLERELASKTRDADHFFQLSGRLLEELNAVQSATGERKNG